MKRISLVISCLLMLMLGSLTFAQDRVKVYNMGLGVSFLNLLENATALYVGLNSREGPIIYYLEDSHEYKRRRFIQMVERDHEVVPDGYEYIGMINFENVIIYFVFEKK